MWYNDDAASGMSILFDKNTQIRTTVKKFYIPEAVSLIHFSTTYFHMTNIKDIVLFKMNETKYL